MNNMQWIAVTERLPDIAEGEKCSQDVLAGCWIEDSWLRDDHPEKRRFIFGACRVMETTNLREFPEGKQWLTFGPSHAQITHWMPVEGPA